MEFNRILHEEIVEIELEHDADGLNNKRRIDFGSKTFGAYRKHFCKNSIVLWSDHYLRIDILSAVFVKDQRRTTDGERDKVCLNLATDQFRRDDLCELAIEEINKGNSTISEKDNFFHRFVWSVVENVENRIVDRFKKI